MSHRLIFASKSRTQTAALSVSTAVLLLASSASAAELDFNVASGNYTAASNWIDTTNPVPVPAAAAPTVADNVWVRNNGTLTISSNVEARKIKVGWTRVITNPDYDNNGVVDAADYVLWRKGGPLLNDATPADVGPDDYDFWRYRFGGMPLSENIGQAGTLNWTDGEITGPASTGANLGGPDIRVGRHQIVNGVSVEVPGTMVQNGPNTRLILPYGDGTNGSVLTIGEAGTGAFSNNPISSYTLMNGTIGTGVSSSSFTGSQGTNNNNGILVRNGTFTMTGGSIIDSTQEIFAASPTAQRFLTVATQAGGGEGNEAVSTANLSGGNINSLGGIRVGTANHSKGIVNISGTVNIVTGGDTSLGYQPNTGGINGTGVMNMSGGTFQVGRTDPNPNNGNAAYDLAGRFHVGDRGKGTLNMSGGTINVTRNVVVGNETAYQEGSSIPKTFGSAINMTGGTITTGGLEMRRTERLATPDPTLPEGVYSASIIVDGPTASFITTGLGNSPNSVIGNAGKALFEIRQGTAVLGGGGATVELGATAASSATINVKGGKLTFGGRVNRANLSSTAPDVNLTGGTLEFNNTTSTGTHIFYADLNNEGSKLVAKPNALQLVQVGSTSPNIPANFAMTSGSWDLEIGAHNVFTGADSFNIPNGTASLAGGTLNISYLPGFTPNVNEVFRIVRASQGTTLNSGAVTITGADAGNWALQEVLISGVDEEIQLKYIGPSAGLGSGLGSAAVPEPSSAVLVLFVALGLIGRRAARRHAA
jgi:hypothetical protein